MVERSMAQNWWNVLHIPRFGVECVHLIDFEPFSWKSSEVCWIVLRKDSIVFRWTTKSNLFLGQVFQCCRGVCVLAGVSFLCPAFIFNFLYGPLRQSVHCGNFPN